MNELPKWIQEKRDDQAEDIIWYAWQDQLAKFAPKTERKTVIEKLDYHVMYDAGFNAAMDLVREIGLVEVVKMGTYLPCRGAGENQYKVGCECLACKSNETLKRWE